MSVGMAQVSIVDLMDGASVEAQYASNTSETTAPSLETSWDSSMPPHVEGHYIWKRERTLFADGSYTEWGTPFRITGSKGDTGATGPQGPQGPPGEVGRLGLYAVGDTIYLKGYAEDGTLTASQGYVYIDSTRHTVPAFSQTLTQEGQGYVVYDSINEVVNVTRMEPQTSRMDWKDYETNTLLNSSALVVIGKFKRDSTYGITDISTTPPRKASSYVEEQFMEVLAGATITPEMTDEEIQGLMDSWCEALGITQFFEKLAVWEFFANRIKTNHLEIEKTVNIAEEGDPEDLRDFKLIMSNTEGSSPIIRATRSEPNGEDLLMFELDAKTGKAVLNGGGDFTGTITHEALVTQGDVQGASISGATSGYAWNTSDLHDDLTSINEWQTPQSASGSYNGKSFDKITRLPSDKKAILGSYSQPTEYFQEWNPATSKRYRYFIFGVYTVPTDSNRVSFNFEAYYLGRDAYPMFAQVIKNPPGTYSVGDYYNSSYSSIGGTIIYSYSVYNSYYSYSGSADVSPGDKLYFCIYNDEDFDGKVYGKNVAVTAYSSIIGPGIFLKYTDNTTHIIRLNQYRTDLFSITSPQSWASSSNLIYHRGDGVVYDDDIMALPLGVPVPASGSLIVNPLGSTGAHTYTVTNVRRGSSSVAFGTTEGTVVIYEHPDDYSSTGLYDSVSFSITLVAQVRAAKVSSLMPLSNDTKDLKLIGDGSNRFTEAHIENLFVYGGVFGGGGHTIVNIERRDYHADSPSTSSKTLTGLASYWYDAVASDTNIIVFLFAHVSINQTGSDNDGWAEFNVAAQNSSNVPSPGYATQEGHMNIGWLNMGTSGSTVVMQSFVIPNPPRYNSTTYKFASYARLDPNESTSGYAAYIKVTAMASFVIEYR